MTHFSTSVSHIHHQCTNKVPRYVFVARTSQRTTTQENTRNQARAPTPPTVRSHQGQLGKSGHIPCDENAVSGQYLDFVRFTDCVTNKVRSHHFYPFSLSSPIIFFYVFHLFLVVFFRKKFKKSLIFSFSFFTFFFFFKFTFFLLLLLFDIFFLTFLSSKSLSSKTTFIKNNFYQNQFHRKGQTI